MKNLKDSKNLKVPKRSSKLQEGCHLRKIHSSKETFKKNSSERLTLEESHEFQKFKENFKRMISNFKNPREISKMEGSFQRWMDLNDEFLK